MPMGIRDVMLLRSEAAAVGRRSAVTGKFGLPRRPMIGYHIPASGAQELDALSRAVAYG